MRTKIFEQPSAVEKKSIIESLQATLLKHAEISFTYLHGSFAQGQSFRDIDLAVYLNTVPQSPLQYELALEAEFMSTIARYPSDARILNNAPLSFKYQVIKNGILLFVRNDDVRATFQEVTLMHYFDFAPFRSYYLKETLGIGI